MTISTMPSNLIKHHWLGNLLPSTHPKTLRQSLETFTTTLPLFQQLQTPQPDFSWISLAEKIRTTFTDVIILGTGGSSLGAQTLCALSRSAKPRLHFMENIDTDSFERLWASVNPATSFCLVVSKSGQTAETLLQLLISQQHWPKNALAEHFLIITENKPNALRTLANTWHIPCLEHPPIGGRYSCFSLVGLLPAVIAGLSVTDILAGATDYWQEQMHPENPCEPLRAASYLNALLQQGKSQSVMMPYCDRLRPFSRWYAQLWAESLGKNGKGMTPLPAIGAVDQHSQLQLYLDGPRDKVFTLITLAPQSQTETVQEDLNALPSPLPLFEGKNLNNLMVAEQRATLETLYNQGCPVREIRLETLTEKTLGALMMHFILETLAMSLFLEVDPLDQPAVEEGKRLAEQYLKNQP
jgi:glucose-6-phosphate isomerase